MQVLHKHKESIASVQNWQFKEYMSEKKKYLRYKEVQVSDIAFLFTTVIPEFIHVFQQYHIRKSAGDNVLFHYLKNAYKSKNK